MNVYPFTPVTTRPPVSLCLSADSVSAPVMTVSIATGLSVLVAS